MAAGRNKENRQKTEQWRLMKEELLTSPRRLLLQQKNRQQQRVACGRSSKGRKRDHELLGVVLSLEQRPKELAGTRKLPETALTTGSFLESIQGRSKRLTGGRRGQQTRSPVQRRPETARLPVRGGFRRWLRVAAVPS